MWGRFVDTLYMTYLTYSRDNEDNVLALWQPILRTVFLHLVVSLLYEKPPVLEFTCPYNIHECYRSIFSSVFLFVGIHV